MLPKIVVGIPCQLNGAYRPFDVNVAQLQKAHPELEIVHGMTGVVPGARNRIVREAIARKAEYIWWLDDDQPFNPGGAGTPEPLGDLERLLAHGKDAVIPLSLRRGAPFMPLIYDAVGDNWNARQHYLEPHESGLIPVAGAGMAGLLIKMSALLAMGEDGWFEFVHPPDNFDDYAEDFPFYRRLAASGTQLYCDLDTRFGHAVTCVAYPVKENGQWLTVLADAGPFVGFPQPVDPEKANRRIVTPHEARRLSRVS